MLLIFHNLKETDWKTNVMGFSLPLSLRALGWSNQIYKNKTKEIKRWALGVSLVQKREMKKILQLGTGIWPIIIWYWKILWLRIWKWKTTTLQEVFYAFVFANNYDNHCSFKEVVSYDYHNAFFHANIISSLIPGVIYCDFSKIRYSFF